MAEPVKTEQPKEEKKVVLLNQGKRSFQTKSGLLKPGESLEVGEAEAKDLLHYGGEIVDASKIVKGAHSADLRAENEKLKAENVELKAEIEKLKKPPAPHSAGSKK